MQGKYDQNPIYFLYSNLSLELALSWKNSYPRSNSGSNLDDMLKLILLNNGCKISKDGYIYDDIKWVVPNEYEIHFISGMIGNDVNEYYDFLIFNGKKILVIFSDYFRDIYDGTIAENDPMWKLKVSMGNSIYYDAIKKIVEVFYLTFETSHSRLLSTSMATTQRWNQAIIAIHILNKFKPVDENDVSDMSIEDINNILNGNIELQLYGIRTM